MDKYYSQSEAFLKFQGKTYAQILEVMGPFVMPECWSKDNRYDLIDMDNGYIRELGIAITFYWSDDIPFLYERESGLNWLCTDTEVGLFFLFEIMENGEERVVGLREQTGRKTDSEYAFFDQVVVREVKIRVLDFVAKREEAAYQIIDINTPALT